MQIQNANQHNKASLNPAENQSTFTRIKRHSLEIGGLAGPVSLNRIGILLITVFDLATLGQVSPQELAYFSLGQAPFVVLLVICIGLLLGTLINTSQALGENNPQEAGATWRRSLPYSFLIGCLCAVLLSFGEYFFAFLRQPDDLINGAAQVSFILGLSLIPSCFLLTGTYFLEAIKRPRAVTVFILLAILINMIGNHAVVDTYGAIGVAWITFATRVFLGVGLTIYIWFLRGHHEYQIRQRPFPGWWVGGKIQRRHGYAAGASLGFETIAFALMNIFAGWISNDAVAIYGITANLVALAFMVSVGVGTATGVRVGIAQGRKDARDRKIAGWTGFALINFLMFPIAGILLLYPQWAVSFYLADETLIRQTALLMMLIVSINFFDGGQAVLQSALRATNDKMLPTTISFISYFLIMIPLAYIFAIHQEAGVAGLLYAILAASLFSVSALIIRWFFKSREIF